MTHQTAAQNAQRSFDGNGSDTYAGAACDLCGLQRKNYAPERSHDVVRQTTREICAGSASGVRYHGTSGSGSPSRAQRSRSVGAGTYPRTAGSSAPTPFAWEKTFLESAIRTGGFSGRRAKAAATLA